MPTLFNQLFKHLRSDEIAVWLRFLSKFPDRFTDFDYDVRVGPGVNLPPETPENIKKMALGLSQKRIDVVAKGVEGLTLVEVSPNAGGDSVGQLLVYKALWELEHPDQPSPNLLLVSGFERSDIREVSRVAGVELLVV